MSGDTRPLVHASQLTAAATPNALQEASLTQSMIIADLLQAVAAAWTWTWRICRTCRSTWTG